MSNAPDPDAGLKKLISKAYVPSYPSEKLNIGSIDAITRDIGYRSSAAGSYTLNRVHTWLRETKDRFKGADGLGAEWSRQNGIVTCHLKPAEGTESWKVVWATKYSVERIEVISIDGDVETPLLEGSFYERKIGAKKEGTADPNTVTGGVADGINLKDVARFTKAISPYVPESIKDFNPDTVPIDLRGPLQHMSLAIFVDGGLPGEICWMQYARASEKASNAITTFVANNHKHLVDRLDGLNAKWGEGCVNVGDDDAHVCTVRSNGAVALFYVDHATTADRNTGLILLRGEEDKAKTLEVHVFEQSDDVASQVEEIMQGNVPADHAVDLEDMSSETVHSARGFSAVNAMAWWFVVANDPSLYGEVQVPNGYWTLGIPAPAGI